MAYDLLPLPLEERLELVQSLWDAAGGAHLLVHRQVDEKRIHLGAAHLP